MIVEGEKAAEAARGLWPFASWNVTTSSMGAGSAARTDWTPTRGVEATTWPDADAKGARYAEDSAELCREAGAKSVRVVDVSGLPDGWDLADDIPEDDVRKMLASAKKAVRAASYGIVRGDDFMDEADYIDWIWNGWLPARALTLLAGPKGLGKSTLALHFAAQVTRGECPGQNGEPGSVLLWSGEDDKRVIAARAAAANLDASHFGRIDTGPDDCEFDPAIHLQPLIDYLEDDENLPDVLIIDPVIRILKGGNNSAEDVRRSLDPLASYAERRGITILGIGHFTKGSGDRPIIDRYMGSGAWTQRARMVWGVIEVAGVRLFGKAATNLADARGVFQYSVEPCVVDTRRVKGINTTRIDLCEPITEETLDQAEARMRDEAALEGRNERYEEDAGKARQWLRERGGCVTSNEWAGFCAKNKWSTGNNGRGRKIAEVLELRTARVGRAGPEQKTYRCLPQADVPR